jgi:hypothetical protein
MKNEKVKRQQVLLRLPVDLIELIKEKAKEEGMLLNKFCEKYLSLVYYLDLYTSSGQITTKVTKRRMLLIPALQYDQMYAANATYREGRRLGLEFAPMLKEFSVEDTLTLFSRYGWGTFEFQAEAGRVINSNPPVSSSEFMRGLLEGLTELTLRTVSADRDVFVYGINL